MIAKPLGNIPDGCTQLSTLRYRTFELGNVVVERHGAPDARTFEYIEGNPRERVVQLYERDSVAGNRVQEWSDACAEGEGEYLESVACLQQPPVDYIVHWG